MPQVALLLLALLVATFAFGFGYMVVLMMWPSASQPVGELLV